MKLGLGERGNIEIVIILIILKSYCGLVVMMVMVIPFLSLIINRRSIKLVHLQILFTIYKTFCVISFRSFHSGTRINTYRELCCVYSCSLVCLFAFFKRSGCNTTFVHPQLLRYVDNYIIILLTSR